MEIMDFIAPELIVLIPVLYGIGRVLKEISLKDKYIPLTLTIISIIFTGLYIFSSRHIATPQEIAQGIFSALTQGVLIVSTAVYTDQVIKQAKKDE